MNPESYSSASITPRVMYNYSRGLNKSWNMPEYKAPRIYQDPALQVQKRKWESQKKGQKTDKYVTKRGFYMDYHIKVSKSIPSSTVHGSQEPWSFKKELEKSKNKVVDLKVQKNTYIEQIELEQTKRKKPGIGTYSIEKSIKQKQEMIAKLKQAVVKPSQKRYFYENTESLSQSVPGAGNYNPHDEIQNVKLNKSDYKYWVDKHRKQSIVMRKRELSVPTAGTYTPMEQTFRTFDLVKTKSKKQLEKKNGFGSDARFPYVRPEKKVIKQLRPSPSSYNTGIRWRGKSYDEKGKQWHEALWKGSLSESIYR